MTLPLPIEDFVPKLLRQRLADSEEGQALIDKTEELLEEIRDEILDMYYFKLPERIHSNFLAELGYFLNAGILDTDSDAVRRKKISTAIQTHKNRGTWEYDAKIRIDNITGYSAALYSSIDNDDSIEMGNTQDEIDQGLNTYYWSTESGYDGSDDELGTWEVGSGAEFVYAGNIAIDCHEGVFTPVLSASKIAQIVYELQDDVVPAYMRVLLGYVNTSGQFIIYDTIG